MLIPLVQNIVAMMTGYYAQAQMLKQQRAEFRLTRIMDVQSSTGCTFDEAAAAVDVADAMSAAPLP